MIRDGSYAGYGAGRYEIVTRTAEPPRFKRPSQQHADHRGLGPGPWADPAPLTWDTGYGALSSPRTFGRRITGLIIAGIMLVSALALAGCSADSDSSASSSGMAKAAGEAPAAPVPAGAATSGGGAAQQQGGTGTTTARLAPAGDIIYTAQLTVRARSVNPAAATAAQITESAGGYVSNETTSTDPDRPSQATATVQLKIPVSVYQATLSKLEGGLGAQISVHQQAQDVTQQVADVNSQVTSDEAAITQLRALLSHAGSVSELLSVQNQINGEESSLEAMQAQQRSLDHEVSYATVTLTILGPQAKPLVHHAKAPPSLAGGLGAGWRALRITVSWTLAFVGAIAPFALIAALAAFVIYRGRRWLLRRRLPAEPTARET